MEAAAVGVPPTAAQGGGGGEAGSGLGGSVAAEAGEAAAGAPAEAAVEKLGLLEAVAQAYIERGLRRLYDWQAACLAAPGVAEGRNLVYCAPTSGGKTLVSEVLMLRRVWNLKKRAIFVLPYVSVVTEKTQYLKDLCRHTRISVKGFHGGSPDSIREHFDIAVCTIEKANALVNFLIEEGTLAQTVGTFVVDEMHLVGDGSRGYLLELTVSKVLYLAKDIQIIGMSATLPNVEDIVRWIGGTLYSTSYRPVPLSEFVLADRQLFHPDQSPARALSEEGLSPETLQADTTGLVAATWEVTREGHSVLVFCSSRVKCEKTAALLAELLPVARQEAAQREAREALLAATRGLPCGADATLAKTLGRGVAFHHGALTTEERYIVEKGYRQGAISVICATSTLAAGVNLPARRVIFSTPYMGNAFLDPTQYRQMAGRAGRAGQGVLGEAVIIAPSAAKRQVFALVEKSLPRVASCLRDEVCGLKRLLLEVLSVAQLGKGEDLIKFCESTLLSTQKVAQGRTLTGNPMTDYPEIASAMQWLLGHDMARLDERIQAYTVTPLGRAICASGLDPSNGYVLFQEMERARPCISLDTDLHICYLVTPPDGSVSVSWSVFNNVLRHLSSAERRVADRVGVRLDLVDKAEFQGNLASKVMASLDGIRLQRFYSSLVLWAVLHETPVPQLLQRFQLHRGQLQQLQQAAASFTTTVAVFCNRLQWASMEALVLSFQQRLTFGVRSELVPLMQIENMDCVVARALYESGFTTPVGIAGARPVEVLRVLRKTLPHNVPSAALPESTAERLIEAARLVSKAAVKEKQKKAREARKSLRKEAEESCTLVPPRKRPRTEPATQPAAGAAAAAGRPAALPRAPVAPDPRAKARPPLVAAPGGAGHTGTGAHVQQSPQPPSQPAQPGGQHLRPPPQMGQVAQPAQLAQPGAHQVRPPPQMGQGALPAQPGAPQVRPPPQMGPGAQAAQAGARQVRPPPQLGQLARPAQPVAHQMQPSPQSSPVVQPLQPLGSAAQFPRGLVHSHAAAVACRSAAGPPPPAQAPPMSPMSPPRAAPPLPAQTEMSQVGGATAASPPSTAGEHRGPLESILASCATPCRALDGGGVVQSPENVTPKSAEEMLGEGLRRLGRSSLTPRDVEAVSVSPGTARRRDLEQQHHMVGQGSGERGCARSKPSGSSNSGLPQAAPVHPARASEAAFLASAFAASESMDCLQAPALQVLMPSDSDAYSSLAEQLLHCPYVGASVVEGGGSGTEVLCLTLKPEQAYCLVLPPEGPLCFGSHLWHWLSYERHLCITTDAKELVGALLRRGVDVSCGLAEPRIAHWLLDPDDKLTASNIMEVASLHSVKLAPPGAGAAPLIRGDNASLEPALRARIVAHWPGCFLALPLMAALLQKLGGQMLLDSFWQVEMPFAGVLAWMEHIGIGCESRDPLQTQSHILYKLAAIQERVREIVGRRVALSSSEDVGRAIFEDLGLPAPRGTRFRRKTNGRFAYRSPVELLRQLPHHEVVGHVLEHRHLTHVMRRIEALLHAGAPRRPEPLCVSCCSARASGGDGGVAPASSRKLRLRTDLVQTGTATGRLATASGSLPLLTLDNPFQVREVVRPSLHDELARGQDAPPSGTRVFVAVASEAPPKPRQLREGQLESVQARSCADIYPGGTVPLAAYWASHGWESYSSEERARSIGQVLVRHGTSVLSYPADKVWRLAAPISLSDDAPLLTVNPRRLLVAEPGWVLLSVDYSQLEVRLMAHFSQDERFVQMLRGDGDVFRHVAAGWLRKQEEEVTAEERSGAKRICYGLIYGIGTGRLALELGISRAQAAEFQESFMREYSGIAAWVQACRERARRCGYVETLHGRRRFLPGLAARAHAERSHAERQAVNTSCQASAADLVKTAMLRIHGRLKAFRVHEGGQCLMPARMLLQIHDELLFEIREDWLQKVQELVVAEMVGAGDQLRVPLQVKWKTGRSWGALE